MEEEKVWTHKQWAAICESCGGRRILYPMNQNVSSLDDPKCEFIHIGSGKKECS